MSINTTTQRGSEHPGDDALLAALVDASRSPEPTEFEIARLRRKVSAARRAEHSVPARVPALRAAAVACTLLVGIGSLHLSQLGTSGVPGSEGPVDVARLAGGSIELRIAGARQVIRSTSPDGRDGVPVAKTDEGVFIDDEAELEPGSIVYYRVD